MIFTSWVLELSDARTSPGVTPMKGVDHPHTRTHHYTLSIDGAVGPDGIATGVLHITSATPLTWRAGQNIMIEISDVPQSDPAPMV